MVSGLNHYEHPIPQVTRTEHSTMQNTIKTRRTEMRWSQAELGEHLGVSRQTVIAIENGKYDPSLPLAFKLASVFETSIEELFTPDTSA